MRPCKAGIQKAAARKLHTVQFQTRQILIIKGAVLEIQRLMRGGQKIDQLISCDLDITDEHLAAFPSKKQSQHYRAGSFMI
jgi:hypothetical protein